MPDELSVGKLAVDIQPYLDSLGLAQQASARATQAIVDGSARVTKSFADLAQQQIDSTNRVAAQVTEYRNAQEAARSAGEAVRQYAAREKELLQQQKGLNSTTAEYQRITKELEKNAKAIAQAKQAQQESTAAARDAQRAAQGIAEANRQAAQQVKLEAAASRDAAAAAKQQAAAAREAASASEDASKKTGFFSGLLGKAGALFGGLFIASKIKEVGEEIIQVTGEFQRYEAVLTNSFQGNNARAKAAILEIQGFADANGISVSALTETYTKLVNRGIIPTQNQLRQLSDIASASGKSTEQFIEALLDAQQNEFIRLREFGIKVKNNGDTVAFSFRGITTEVKNSQQAIADYLFRLGDLNGVQGTTAALAEQTNGRIVTLKNSFDELFKTIGEGSGGPINAFVKGLTIINQKAAQFLKTDKQKIDEEAASNSKSFADSIDKQFEFAAERAKKNGKSVYYAIYDVARIQQQELQKQFEEANKNINDLNSIDKGYRNSADRAALVQRVTGNQVQDPNNEPLLREAEKAALLGQRAYLEYVKQSQQALKERAAVAVEGATKEEEAVGRIAALRAKIKREEEEREKATNTTKGNARREELNDQIEADRKLLKLLLGEEEKLKKARQYSYEAQLRALLQEREKLTGLAAKASERAADDAAARAKAVFEEGLRQVDVLAGELRRRELELRKAAQRAGGSRAVTGLGEKADGVIDGAQEQGLTQLRLAALDKYYTDLYKITEAREQRLFDLRANSDEKEIEAINRKYDKQLQVAKDAIERQAVEEARARDQLALRQQQTQGRIDGTANLATANAQRVGEVFGEGTGVSVIEAKRAEKRALLEIEQKHAQDTLNNTLLLQGKEGELARAQAAATLARIKNDLKEVDREKASHKADDFLYKLILGDEDSEANRAKVQEIVGEAVQAITTILQAEQQAAQARIDIANRNISELQTQLAAQIQLNEQGSASNIKGIIDQINAEKSARREAIAEKKRAQKEEALVNTLQQASSLATAAANLILGWSSLPLVGQVLGAISVAAMLASFIATKAAANNAANSDYFVGGFTPEGGKYEEAGTVHKGEFVANQELTRDYRSLFKALHEGDTDAIDWSSPKMRALLPDYSLPGQLRTEKDAHVRHSLEISHAPLQAELKAVRSELADIKSTNAQMADQRTAIPVEGGYLIYHPATGSTDLVTVR